MMMPLQDDLWQQPWMLELLRLPVTGPQPEMVTQAVLGAVAVLLCLPIRRPCDRRLFWNPVLWLWLVVGACGGALLGMATILVADEWMGMVPMGLPWGARVWVTLAATVLGLVIINLLCARWWRKIIAVLMVLPVLAVTAVGVNAQYGILRSVGELVGKSSALVSDVEDLPPIGGHGLRSGEWLAQHWHRPASLQAEGRRLTMPIPATVSGFEARHAQVYLPPAALVTDAPRLPVVLLMMGQPGTPDVSHIADELDKKAAVHDGLAPIVVVADQIGDPLHDTLCMDTTQFGKVETYINTDVVAWIKTHLRVSDLRSDWTVAGYSNGGLCAARYLARHHDIWGNALDISGEEFPGSDHPAQTLETYFGGDEAAYKAERVPALFQGKQLDDTWFIGTVSANDNEHRPGTRRVCTAAREAGAHVTYLQFVAGGHGVETLKQGLEQGLQVLYPRVGLDPRVDPTAAGPASETFIPEPSEE